MSDARMHLSPLDLRFATLQMRMVEPGAAIEFNGWH